MEGVISTTYFLPYTQKAQHGHHKLKISHTKIEGHAHEKGTQPRNAKDIPAY
jgi:hypothetical protein